MTRKYSSLQERLFANSIISEEYFYEGTPCWDWIGAKVSGKEYGRLSLRIDGKHHMYRAHRVSQFAFKNESLKFDGRVDMHLCDRPCCIAPLHLVRGTSSENNQDTVRKGRHKGFENVPSLRSQFTEEVDIYGVPVVRDESE